MDVIDNNLNASNLIEKLLEIKSRHGIDRLCIAVVDRETIYTLMDTEQLDASRKYSYLSVTNRENKKNSIYDIVISMLKPVRCRAGVDAFSPITEGIVEEICIPLKVCTMQDMVVCVYFGFKIATGADIRKLTSDFYTEFNPYEIVSCALERYFNIYKMDKSFKYLMVLQDALKANQPFMVLHPVNVAFWSVEIAQKLDLDEDMVEKIYYAAIFHDIGKIGIPSYIINKDEQITEEEYKIVKKHVKYGYIYTKELLGDIYQDVPDWIYCHHEKFDGTGYPEGLKGEDIPLASRILKVADVIDVLYSPRSYKKHQSVEAIINELNRCKEKDFDPQVVAAAEKVIFEKLITSGAVLNDSFLPASISFHTTGGEIINLSGYYYREFGENSCFKCSDVIDTDMVKKAISCSLVVEKLNQIYEYEVDASPVNENTLSLANIRPREGRSSFSILWDLPALIYESGDAREVKARVIRLSANYFIFAADEDLAKNRTDFFKSKIFFDNGKELMLNGRIDYSYKGSGNVNYYKYVFINLPERLRDELFRQIFRKQLSLRRSALYV